VEIGHADPRNFRAAQVCKSLKRTVKTVDNTHRMPNDDQIVSFIKKF